MMFLGCVFCFNNYYCKAPACHSQRHSIHLIAGSKTLASLTLAFVMYTISLHLAISGNFFQVIFCPFPTSTRTIVLHGLMPLLELSNAIQAPSCDPLPGYIFHDGT